MKKAFKKIMALATGAAMLGATVTGAMAADLADYPAPFVEDGEFNSVLVVGDTAAPEDIIGITDISMALQYDMKTEESVECPTGALAVDDGIVEEVAINGDLSGSDFDFGSLDDSDISVLQDSEVEIDDEDIDFEETIVLTSGLKLASSSDDEDYEDGIHLEITEGSFSYKWNLTENANTSWVSEDDELDIDFLGEEITITEIGSNKVTLQSGTTVALTPGDSVEVEGKTVTLLNVNSDGVVLVDVDGSTETVEDSEDVGGLSVEVDSYFYEDAKADRQVTLLVRDEDEEVDIKDGEPATLYGEPDDDKEAEWLWTVSSDDTGLTLGLEYNQERDRVEDDPIQAGGAYVLPEDFVKVEFVGLNVEDADYADFEFDFEDGIDFEKDNGDDVSDGGMDADVLRIRSTDGEKLKIGGEDTETIYIGVNSSGTVNGSLLFGYDDDGSNVLLENALPGDAPTMDFDWGDADDLTFALEGNNTAGNLNLTIDDSSVTDVISGGKLSLSLGNIANAKLGDDEEDAESDDVRYAGSGIGTKEDNYRTSYGVVVLEPEGNADNDEVHLQVPSQQVMANIAVVPGEGSVASDSTDATSVAIEKIGTGATKLASEAQDMIGSDNMIVVGGPAVNSVAAELMGNPTREEILATFEQGKALVKLFEEGDSVAMLVAGYDAIDTRRATRVIANHEDYSGLEGQSVNVVTATDSMTIVSATSDGNNS